MCEHCDATRERCGAQHLEIAGSLGATAARALHHRAAIRRGYGVVRVGAVPQQHSHLQSYRQLRTCSLTVGEHEHSVSRPVIFVAACWMELSRELLWHGTMSLLPLLAGMVQSIHQHTHPGSELPRLAGMLRNM
jgi:hypothetical protein